MKTFEEGFEDGMKEGEFRESHVIHNTSDLDGILYSIEYAIGKEAGREACSSCYSYHASHKDNERRRRKIEEIKHSYIHRMVLWEMEKKEAEEGLGRKSLCLIKLFRRQIK